MNTNELQLLRAAKAGDENAWRQLLHIFDFALKRFVNQSVRFGRDEDDAWSRCHEAFVRCVRAFDESKGLKFSTLLFTCLTNATAAAMRRGPIYLPVCAYKTDPDAYRAAVQVRSMDARNRKTGRTMHNRIGQAGESYSDLRERLAAALEQLPSRDRSVVTMRLQGLKYREIGDLQGTSSQRAAQIENRAHRTLRALLGEDAL